MLSDVKQQIRNTFKKRRLALSSVQQHHAAHAIISPFLNHEKVQSAKRIALFLSFNGEIETQPLIETLWAEGKEIYLPVVHPYIGGRLHFQHYTPTTPMMKNKFNILEPQLDLADGCLLKNIDVIAVPMVAFDDRGYRLGLGGGFYDRALNHWQESQIYPIGLAHDCQHVGQLACDDFDIPLPEIITPEKHYRW